VDIAWMNIVWWVLIVASFVGAYAALIFPIVPGVPLLWAGALIYQLAINPGELSWFFWTILVLASVMLFVSDFVANRVFLDKSGSSEWSKRIGPLAVLAGAFVIPPFGLILVPFAVVFVTEILHKKDHHEAFRLAGITVVSFLTSTAAKLILQSFVILIFIIDILI